MKWRRVLITLISALVAVTLFLPAQSWWAIMTMLFVGAGIFFESLEKYLQEARAKLTGERDLLGGMRMSLLFWLLAFVTGIICAQLNGLSWWCSTLVGVLNVVVFAVVVTRSIKATEEKKAVTHSRTTKPPLKAISR